MPELLGVLAIGAIASSLLIPAGARIRAAAHQAACMGNMRQLGTAFLQYANDHNGTLPRTTHYTDEYQKTWIYLLKPYVDDVDKIRVCPAEPADRKKKIMANMGTSYVLNDQVVEKAAYRRLLNIPYPSRTMLLSILSENKNPSITGDHIHGAEWTSWNGILADIEPDRHRPGKRESNRLKGSSNYLYADGHVENISAQNFKKIVDSGVNPSAVTTTLP